MKVFFQLRSSRKSSQSSQIRVCIFHIITLKTQASFFANISDRKGLKSNYKLYKTTDKKVFLPS